MVSQAIVALPRMVLPIGASELTRTVTMKWAVAPASMLGIDAAMMSEIPESGVWVCHPAGADNASNVVWLGASIVMITLVAAICPRFETLRSNVSNLPRG